MATSSRRAQAGPAGAASSLAGRWASQAETLVEKYGASEPGMPSAGGQRRRAPGPASCCKLMRSPGSRGLSWSWKVTYRRGGRNTGEGVGPVSGPHSGSGACRQHWARGSSGLQNPPGVTQSHPLQGSQHSSFTHTPPGFTGASKALKMGTDETHRAERMQAGVGLPQTGEGLLDTGQPCPERGRVLLKRQVQRPWGRSFSRLAEEESIAEAGGRWVRGPGGLYRTICILFVFDGEAEGT